MLSLIENRDSIITQANLKGANIPLNADYSAIIEGITSIAFELTYAEIETLLEIILGEIVEGDYTVKAAAINYYKEGIRQAIIDKGIAVGIETPFSTYATAISNIVPGIPESTINDLLDGIAGEVITGDYTAKIDSLESSKEDMRLAILSKGVDVPVETVLQDYPTKISAIDLGYPAATVNDLFDLINGEIITGNLVDKSQTTFDSKGDIRLAIIAKGVDVPEETVLQEYATKISAIEAVAVGTIKVLFIDSLDGTIVKTEYVSSGGNATPPLHPSHTYLTSQGWVGVYNNVLKDVCIFSSYSVTDGKSYIKILLTAFTGKAPTLYFNKTTTAILTIDWGDGTTSTSVTAGSQNVAHIYATYGSYVITVTCTTGYYFGNNSASTTIFGSSSSGNYRYILKGYYNGINATSVGSYCFSDQYCLTELVLPEGLTSLNGYAFNRCWSLSCFLLPSTVSTLSSNYFFTCLMLRYVYLSTAAFSSATNMFQTCQSLEYIYFNSSATGLFPESILYACSSIKIIDCIPPGITSTGVSAVGNNFSVKKIILPPGLTAIAASLVLSCISLEEINIPSGVTTVGTSAFDTCRNLKSLDFPSGVTSIGALAFNNCLSLKIYVFRSTTPPTIATNTFTYMHPLAVIYVPDANVADYKAAPYWSIWTDYIQPLSLMP